MIIYGKKPVLEFLNNSPDIVEKVYITGGGTGRDITEIIDIVETVNIQLSDVTKQQLNDICRTPKHQGVAARIKDFEYTGLESLLNITENKNKVIVILDHLEDPQNFGAILRTCNFFSVDGVVIPRDRSVSVTPSVVKVSAGAASSIPVSKVTNLSTTLKKLKQHGFWIIGTDASGKDDIKDLDTNGMDIALIVGRESRGISSKIKEHCDYLASIPCYGGISSLNVSVATGIFLYELSKGKGTFIRPGADS